MAEEDSVNRQNKNLRVRRWSRQPYGTREGDSQSGSIFSASFSIGKPFKKQFSINIALKFMSSF
jgi:hypothetical protein